MSVTTEGEYIVRSIRVTNHRVVRSMPCRCVVEIPLSERHIGRCMSQYWPQSSQIQTDVSNKKHSMNGFVSLLIQQIQHLPSITEVKRRV